MNIIQNIVLFFKKIFKKEDNIKKIDAPKDVKTNKTNFVNSLRVNIIKKKKKPETLVCYGDGLGIKGKIEY